jgi:hypothetical protein
MNVLVADQVIDVVAILDCRSDPSALNIRLGPDAAVARCVSGLE